MQYLDCAKNRIPFLPSLPEGLVVLGCEENPLETLPELPPHLTTIRCDLPIDNSRLDLKNMSPETVQSINREVRYWIKVLAEESKVRCIRRCATYKEQIMIKAWHPKRVEMLIDMGYDMEDI